MAEEKKDEKKVDKAPAWMWWVLGIISTVIIIIFIIMIITKEKKEEVVSSVPTTVAIMSLCAGGNYDFSESAVPADLKVDFRSDCVTAVTLPPRAVFRTDPSNNVKIIFVDGSTYLDGPGHQVWYGLKKGVFKVYGVASSGILKITLEKKT